MIDENLVEIIQDNNIDIHPSSTIDFPCDASCLIPFVGELEIFIMLKLKKDRLRNLVQWGYVTQAEANKMYKHYLRLFKKYPQNQKILLAIWFLCVILYTVSNSFNWRSKNG